MTIERKPTKAQQQEAADLERSRQTIRVMLHATLLHALRGLTLDQVIEAWWAANFVESASQQVVAQTIAHQARRRAAADVAAQVGAG